MTIIIIYVSMIVVMSVIEWLLFFFDKTNSRSDGTDTFRVPERVLLGMATLGGGVGGIIGILLHRHKTRQAHMKIPIFIAGILQLLMIGALFLVKYKLAGGSHEL